MAVLGKTINHLIFVIICFIYIQKLKPLSESVICYAENGEQWWTDVTPNFSRTCWKEVSDWYELINGKYVRK